LLAVVLAVEMLPYSVVKALLELVATSALANLVSMLPSFCMLETLKGRVQAVTS
jgi:hypothetical protein